MLDQLTPGDGVTENQPAIDPIDAGAAPDNQPQEPNQQPIPPKNVGQDVYKRAEKAGRNQARNEIIKKFADAGVNIEDIDSVIESLKDVAKTHQPADANPGDATLNQALQEMQKKITVANTRADTAETNLQEQKKTIAIEYAIREQASKKNPFKMDLVTREFMAVHEFQPEDGNMIIKKNGVPCMDQNGKFQTLEESFSDWANGNLWLFKSTSQGGAGIQGGTGGNIDGIDMARVRAGDVDYIRANADKLMDITERG